MKLTSILVKPSKQTPHGEEEAGNSAILPYWDSNRFSGNEATYKEFNIIDFHLAIIQTSKNLKQRFLESDFFLVTALLI